MYLLGIAVLLTLLKLADIEPVASWSWYVILGAYGVTAAALAIEVFLLLKRKREAKT